MAQTLSVSRPQLSTHAPQRPASEKHRPPAGARHLPPWQTLFTLAGAGGRVRGPANVVLAAGQRLLALLMYCAVRVLRRPRPGAKQQPEAPPAPPHPLPPPGCRSFRGQPASPARAGGGGWCAADHLLPLQHPTRSPAALGRGGAARIPQADARGGHARAIVALLAGWARAAPGAACGHAIKVRGGRQAGVLAPTVRGCVAVARAAKRALNRSRMARTLLRARKFESLRAHWGRKRLTKGSRRIRWAGGRMKRRTAREVGERAGRGAG